MWLLAELCSEGSSRSAVSTVIQSLYYSGFTVGLQVSNPQTVCSGKPGFGPAVSHAAPILRRTAQLDASQRFRFQNAPLKLTKLLELFQRVLKIQNAGSINKFLALLISSDSLENSFNCAQLPLLFCQRTWFLKKPPFLCADRTVGLLAAFAGESWADSKVC